MDLAIFEAGMSAEKDGFDAVCIDTMSNSGMAPLRSVLNIPVISPGKASMLYALTLGSKFSILAQWEPALAALQEGDPRIWLREAMRIGALVRPAAGLLMRCSTARKTRSFRACWQSQSAASRRTGRT